MKPMLKDWALLVPLWTRDERDIATMRRFYPGPRRDKITIEGDESTLLPEGMLL